MRPLPVATLLVLLACPVLHAAEPQPQVAAVRRLEGLTLELEAQRTIERDKPVEIASADQAAKYFAGADLQKLLADADFRKERVLIVRWTGSSDDEVAWAADPADPRKIVLRIARGRTRDIRLHHRIFAVGSNLNWSLAR